MLSSILPTFRRVNYLSVKVTNRACSAKAGRYGDLKKYCEIKRRLLAVYCRFASCMPSSASSDTVCSLSKIRYYGVLKKLIVSCRKHCGSVSIITCKKAGVGLRVWPFEKVIVPLFIFTTMQEYKINVTEIVELQTIKDTASLDRIFKDAKETLVNGEAVWLVRKQPGGEAIRFDTFTTLDELKLYKKSVYKYL